MERYLHTRGRLATKQCDKQLGASTAEETYYPSTTKLHQSSLVIRMFHLVVLLDSHGIEPFEVELACARPKKIPENTKVKQK